VASVAKALGVDPAIGLLQQEAERRLERFGPNLLTTRKPVSNATLIVRQFSSSVVVLLGVALVLSLAFGRWGQAAAIAAVLVINAAIGYLTERQAIRSMEALRQLRARSARVRRDGRSREIIADALVPGDVVLLEAGDMVPADMRCTSCAALRTSRPISATVMVAAVAA
jgi:Ca2+-transporting ATPase